MSLLSAIKVWFRNFTVYKTHLAPNLVGNIGEPLISLFAMGYGLGGYIPQIAGMPYISFLAPGLVITSAMYSATFECTFGAYTRLTVQGTYDTVMATPLSVEDLTLGEILWGMTKACIASSVLIAVITVFGLYTPSAGLLAIMLVVGATGYIFASAALCCAALSPSYEFFNYYFTIVIAPMFFLSGVFFPLDRLPEVVQKIALFFPATHSVALIRYFFHGMEANVLLSSLVLIAICFLNTFVAIKLVKRRIVV